MFSDYATGYAPSEPCDMSQSDNTDLAYSGSRSPARRVERTASGENVLVTNIKGQN